MMADDGIYTTNAQIQALAGINANSTSKAVAATDVYVLLVEASINAKTKKNWSDAFATLNIDVKGAVSLLGASTCASIVIMSDMSGFNSVAEAETMLDFLNNQINFLYSYLKEKEQQTFMVKVE